MSNVLTLEHIADYYCIKNGNDSAIFYFPSYYLSLY